MKPTAIRAGTGAVHALLAAVAVVLGALSVRAAQFELQRPIAELRLKDGTVLHDVTFVSVGASSITGKWNGGRGSIPLVQLPDEVRAALVPAAAVKPAVAPLATPTPAPAPDGPGDTALLVPLPTEIELTNGFIMRQCKVVSWQADALTINYVGGKVLVQLANIVPAQRALLVAHREAVYARKVRIEAAKAGRVLPPAPVSPEARAAQIKAGIAAHQLVKGMTQEQVRGTYGYPDLTARDPGAPAYEYWIYAGRGRNAKGAACDRIVGFDGGVLDGWTDKDSAPTGPGSVPAR